MTETVTVLKADLDMLVAACTNCLPPGVSPEVGEAFERLLGAFDEAHGIEGEMPAPEPDPMPDGIWGRVELPGRREHTGWITGGSVWGAEGLIVRDWNGGIMLTW
jgi:hypothetical protein